MPHYVIDTMGKLPGLSGLFVSGIFSASLSTVSAAVNSLAAVTLEDYIKVRLLKQNVSLKHLLIFFIALLKFPAYICMSTKERFS